MKIQLNNYSPAEIIKLLRSLSNLTQDEFASSLNKSRNYINNLENNRTKITLDVFLEILNLYNYQIFINKNNEKSNT